MGGRNARIDIAASTVAYSQAREGAGIFSSGPLTLTNSTLSFNSATQDGGGVAVDTGLMELANATLYSNRSLNGRGGGIANRGGIVRLRNTIVADGTAGSDCAGAIESGGHNLSSDQSCSLSARGDRPGTDPGLEPLLGDGSRTLTHAPYQGSPAIDNGNNESCTTTDQLDTRRPLDGNGDGVELCDIGAAESSFAESSGNPPVASYVPKGRLYVANYYDHTVSVINTMFNNVLATISVCKFPREVVVNPSGTRVYVYCNSWPYAPDSGAGSLSVINTSTNLVRRSHSVRRCFPRRGA